MIFFKSKSMKQFILLFVFLLTLLSSCCTKTCQKSTDNNPLDSLDLVDTTEMKSAFLGCIHRFIKQYPKDSTFILKCGYGYEDRGIFTNGVYINSDVFLIYPAYYDAFMDGGWTVDDMYPSHYFKIDNRIRLPLLTFRFLYEAGEIPESLPSDSV